jgi:N-acetylmuramoyl-L-alanine amidase
MLTESNYAKEIRTSVNERSKKVTVERRTKERLCIWNNEKNRVETLKGEVILNGKKEKRKVLMADPQVVQLANLLFSEASKNPKVADKDATAIAWVVKNRIGGRWGETLNDVIYAPKQFSGVGTPEWNKAALGNMTDDEQNIYKRFMQISYGVLNDTIPDPTGGANHYFNPKLAKPKWAKEMTKTYDSGAQTYYKE